MAATRLTQVERAYFVRKAGGAAPTKPLNQIKREYFIAQTGAAPTYIKTSELELRWLRKIITDALHTIQEDDSEAGLWQQAVITLGLTPSQFINDNKITFYLNAA